MVAADQFAKLVAGTRLPLGEPIDLLPILTFVGCITGIAFPFPVGSGFGLIGLTFAISVIVVGFWVCESLRLCGSLAHDQNP